VPLRLSADASDSTCIAYVPGWAPVAAVAESSDRWVDELTGAVAVNRSNAAGSASAAAAVWNVPMTVWKLFQAAFALSDFVCAVVTGVSLSAESAATICCTMVCH
jgi:hypothetical protein